MVLIYAHTASPRLQYILQLIFNEMMGVDHRIETDQEVFRNYEGPKINYSSSSINDNELKMISHPLLFEEGVKTQRLDVFGVEGYKAFFSTGGAVFPFDIFAASFYLVSRYEEYLPHNKDNYGRYAHQNSLAFRENILQVPLVNIWIKDLARILQKKFPDFNYTFPSFIFQPTYDIDIAWSYKHKGLIRNAGGYIKSPSKERIKVLVGQEKDPFDCYEWLHALHDQYQVKPIYFFLVAKKNGLYDKNILPSTAAMKQLVKQHAQKYTIGLHPSWQSGDDYTLLRREKNNLASMVQRDISLSRQHYIRFDLPVTYRRLIETGISDDYSMGYGSINGFRASIASSFLWYDLQAEKITPLRIHPFCFMDANSFYEQQYSAAQAAEELHYYFRRCREVNGAFTPIWHNNFLGTSPEFSGWRKVYENFIAQAQ